MEIRCHKKTKLRFHAAAPMLASLLATGCGGGSGGGDSAGSTDSNQPAGDHRTIATGEAPGPVTTRLFYTTDTGNGPSSLHAVDPADPANPETVSTELHTTLFGPPEAVLFGTWEGDDGGSLPGLHAPVTIFAETDGHLYRVNAMPDQELSKNRISAESNADSIRFLQTKVDFRHIADSRILYRTEGSTTTKMVRLGADSSTQPTDIPVEDVFEVAGLRDNDGALIGLVGRSGFDVKRFDLEGGETVLSTDVTGFQDLGRIDDRYVFRVDTSLRSLRLEGSGLERISSGGALDNFNVDEVSSDLPTAGRETGYAVLVDENNTSDDGSDDTTKLVELDFDRDTPLRVLQTAGTAGHIGSDLEIGDDRIAWHQQRLDGDSTLVSVDRSTGATFELKQDVVSLSLSQQRPPGNWVVSSPFSEGPKAVKLDDSSQVTIGSLGSEVVPVMFDSQTAPSVTQRFAVADLSANTIATFLSASPDDTSARLDMGTLDRDINGVRSQSIEPHALVELSRADDGEDDLAFIDPDEAGSLTILEQDASVAASAVSGY